MEDLKCARKPVRGRYTKLWGELKSLLASDAKDPLQVETLLRMVQATEADLKKLDDKILELLTAQESGGDDEDDDSPLMREYNKIYEYRDKMLKECARAEAYLREFEVSSRAASPTASIYILLFQVLVELLPGGWSSCLNWIYGNSVEILRSG